MATASAPAGAAASAFPLFTCLAPRPASPPPAEAPPPTPAPPWGLWSPPAWLAAPPPRAELRFPECAEAPQECAGAAISPFRRLVYCFGEEAKREAGRPPKKGRRAGGRAAPLGASAWPSVRQAAVKMSENSSDSDSSCGWTVINHEGSDIEAVASEYEGTGPLELDSEGAPSPLQGNGLQDQPVDLQAESDQVDASPVPDQGCSAPETLQAAPEREKRELPEEGSCVGAASDDSDIVTLEVSKVEEMGSPEELVPVGEEVQASEDVNMGSSSSSQYTFCQPETVFPPHPGTEESSSDETSTCSSPALRRRRAKKRTVSSSEAEDVAPHEQEVRQAKDQPRKYPFSSGLNRCIVLALVIAVSMGFGHFYGTVQIQKRQQLVDKTYEEELSDMKSNLMQCQQEQGSKSERASLKEGLATCLLTTEKEKKSFQSQKHHLTSENLHLRESLEKEEAALALLQEELRRLREQVRQLESKGLGPESPVLSENQKLRAHLEEEKHRTQSFVKQKETLLAEAQMLRRELEKERQLTAALREELEKLSARPAAPGAADGFQQNPEIEVLRARLAELEKKLSFEQQRSDLWEKLYVEVKGHAERREQADNGQKPAGKGGPKANKKKAKATFLGSVKETFDAMKNSTKEFVKHHKEKIKRAKEAVKENLRKFSDSVKSTFRHFKDTTKNIFEEREKKRYGDKRHEAKRKGKAASQAEGAHERPHKGAPGSPRGFRSARRPKDSAYPECPQGPSCSRKHHPVLKGCSGIFDCAHQEFVSLFNKVLDPIRADEFNQLMHKYLQQQVNDFHHWRELEIFVNRFFRNGVFIHDQMLFTDFVNDIKDYLEDMKEYRRSSSSSSSGAFADLDKYIYHYYFHYDPLPQHGPSHSARKAPFTHTQRTEQDRPVLKQQQQQQQQQQQRYKQDGRWHGGEGRSSRRQMASLEIEVGQMPFDPKY